MQLQVVLACLAAVAVAAPHENHHPHGRKDYRHTGIVRDHREESGDGSFHYEFETEDGIHVKAVGTPGYNGQSNIYGFYSFPQDGSIVKVSYVADELGYRPESR